MLFIFRDKNLQHVFRKFVFETLFSPGFRMNIYLKQLFVFYIILLLLFYLRNQWWLFEVFQQACSTPTNEGLLEYSQSQFSILGATENGQIFQLSLKILNGMYINILFIFWTFQYLCWITPEEHFHLNQTIRKTLPDPNK